MHPKQAGENQLFKTMGLAVLVNVACPGGTLEGKQEWSML